MELVLRVLRVVRVGVRMVRGRTHLIEASTRVRRRSHLSRRNTGRDVVRNDSMPVMLRRLIFEQGFVEVLELAPVRSLVIVAWIGIFQVRRPLDET